MSRPPRVLIVATKNIRENPFRHLTLVDALRERGAQPSLALLGKSLSSFGYAAEDAESPVLAGVEVFYVDRLADYRRLARQADAVMLGVWRDNKMLVHLALALGKLVVEVDTVSGLDGWSFGSHALLLKGAFSHRIYQTTYAERYPWLEYVTTGSIAHDLPASQRLPDREEFCVRYGLDPSRPVAVFFPKGIKVFEDKLNLWFKEKGKEYNDWYLGRYHAICGAVRDAGMNLVVKQHPAAYASYRTRRDREYHFWEDFPWAAILEPEDTYACYQHAEVGLSVVSHSVLDFGYFRRPFVYVDVDKAPMPDSVNGLLQKGNCALPPGPSRHWDAGLYDKVVHFPSWVGAACRAEDLAELLTSGDYDDPNPAHYDRFIAEFWHKADGRSATRIAGHVLERLESHRPRLRLRSLAGVTWRIWSGQVRERINVER
jgi:hypothetical protein